MKTLRMFLFAAGLAVAGAESAQAGYPYAWPNELGPTAFGVTGTMYGLGLVPVPPYYALHPPVYYSYPVPRSYGYSPFAYPGCVPTPDVDLLSFPDDAPAAEQEGEDLPPAEPTSHVARGQWIENPFVANPSYGMIANPYATKDASLALTNVNE
jgi:hypothetical protein